MVLPSAVKTAAGQTKLDALSSGERNRNPDGVRFVLRTQNGRLQFHLFETIPIELVFSSSRPDTYTIELDELMNPAGATQEFEVQPQDTVLLTWRQWGLHSFVCCDSERRYLSQQPIIFRRELTDYVRFEKEGTYHLSLTSWRVFEGPRKSADYLSSKTPVISNVLTLTILPDDPEWNAQRLVECLRSLRDPHVRANYNKLKQTIDGNHLETGRDIALTNRLSQTEFARAQKALNALDTEEAIRERVSLLNMLSAEDLAVEREGGGGAGLAQPLLNSTTRPDVVVAQLEARAENTDFGVDYDYVEWWARYVALRDHIEFFHAISEKTRQDQNYFSQELGYELAAKKEICARLESLLPVKNEAAKGITELTIKSLREEIVRAHKASGTKGDRP
jgi:hypothetical protein